MALMKYIGPDGLVYEIDIPDIYDTPEEAAAAKSSMPAKLSVPCHNCDHGNGPTGLNMWNMICIVCDGALEVKVEAKPEKQGEAERANEASNRAAEVADAIMREYNRIAFS